MYDSVRNLWAILFLALFCLGCQSAPTSREQKPQPSAVSGSKERTPLVISLSEGNRVSAPAVDSSLVDGVPLPSERVKKLLEMFPKPLKDRKDKPSFLKRGASKPRPTSVVVKDGLSPTDGGSPIPQIDSKALQVLSISPEGEVPRTPRVSISFSSPMTVVSDSNTFQEKKPFGISIDPQPEGRWRWLGTQTLLFEPEAGEFPRATKYDVVIPGGLADLQGQKLNKGLTQTFTTGRPQVEKTTPETTELDLHPVFYVVFDQPVHARTVEKHTVLYTNGKKQGLNRLTKTEAEKADPRLKEQFEKGFENRVFFFQPQRKLLSATSYTLAVTKGVASIEGPLKSERDSTHLFSTFDTLEIISPNPDFGYKAVGSSEGLVLKANNELDPDSFSQNLITVEPPIENMRVHLRRDKILIDGETKASTTYKFRISGKLTDQYGQTLGKDCERSFRTGKAPKTLEHNFETLTIIDPAFPSKLPVYTTNVEELRVRVYRVEPSNWNEYLDFRSKFRSTHKWAERKLLQPPGERLEERLVQIDGQPDELVETYLDFTKHLDKGEGNLLIWATDPDEEKAAYRDREFLVWVQGTNLGIDVASDHENIKVFVTSLLDGKSVPNGHVSLGSQQVRTNKDGVAELNLPSRGENLCIVESEQGSAFLPSETYYYSNHSGWKKNTLSSKREWFVFDDRGLYRPGETAHVKGYLRKWTRGAKAKLSLGGLAGSKLSWVLRDGRNNKIGKGTTQLNDFGAFDLKVEIPENTNLGEHQLSLSTTLMSTNHYLDVQEFRRPEFEIKASVLSEAPHLLLGDAIVEVSAAYYSGGGISGSEVDWKVATHTASYNPPGRDKYTFGEWRPWWGGRRFDGFFDGLPTAPLEYQGQTDIDGKHRLNLSFEKMNPPRATSVSVSADVTDINRQVHTGSTTLLVHPSERYVGMKSSKNFIDGADEFEVENIVTDIEGKLLVGIPFTVELLRSEYRRNKSGDYVEEESVLETEQFVSSEVPSQVRFRAKDSGTYTIRASVLDKANRLNQTEITVWKAGPTAPQQNRVKLESVTLVPDRQDYHPGDTASILLMAPFSEGEGVSIWSRDGILESQRFSLENGTATIEKKLDEDLIPNVHLHTFVVGKAGYGDSYRPALAGANLNLPISTESRTLKIDINPSAEKLKPGSEVEIDVVVKDPLGAPLEGGEVTLWVVDEAVLGLARYKTPNPIKKFYTRHRSLVETRHSRPNVLLPKVKTLQRSLPKEPRDVPILGNVFRRDNDALLNRGRHGGGNASYLNYDSLVGANAGAVLNSSLGSEFNDSYGYGIDDIDAGAEFSAYGIVGQRVTRKQGTTFHGEVKSGAEFSAYSKERKTKEPSAFKVRRNFNALSLYRAKLATDAAGKTKVKVKIPDNLTRYRIMSVVVKNDDLFGSNDHPLTSRLPLMVRPSLPRFLNFGDRAKLPVVIQNQTDEDMMVDVIGEATGVKWIGPGGKQVKVPANERVEVQFEAEAISVGEPRFRFGAVSGENSDAATVSLPIYTPASGEAFATYGSITEDPIEQSVKRPEQIWEQFGGLKVSLSSTALSELTDAFLYLYRYPHECSEQKASRILAIAAMREVFSSFNPAVALSKQLLKSRIKEDLLHLSRLQNEDGGFEYWRRTGKSSPFVTLHVAHAMVRAQADGHGVKAESLEKVLSYLSKMESRRTALKYSRGTARSLRAYALYIKNIAKQPDLSKTKILCRELLKEENPDLEALGWLWPTLSEHARESQELQDIRRLMQNRASQTAEKAQFTTDYEESEDDHLILRSSRRTDAILLSALLKDQPKNPLNPKLARGLLASRVEGRWNNTQENIWVLLALRDYFRVYEKETPEFLARVWLSEDFLGEESFQGRSAKEAQLNIPMTELPSNESSLTLSKEGQGRLYYRVGMTYAPKNLRLPAEDRGFAVERTYRSLDEPGDVAQEPNGDWTIKAGAKVEVTLTMLAPERRHHVALVDSLPAGLEPLNSSLGGSPKVETEKTDSYNWWSWYDHENLRDEHVEAYASYLSPGVHTYRYVALATTPGDFVLPPLKAEEMYSPEVYGRTATARMRVVP